MFDTLIEDLTDLLEIAMDEPTATFRISPFDSHNIVFELIADNFEFATSPVSIEELLAVLE